MKLQNNSVIIRTATQIRAMNPHIVKALDAVVDKKDISIPVVYQYLHRPGVQFLATSDNTIGKIVYVTKDFKGDYIGTIHLMSLLKLASNYMGVIDNIAVSINQATNQVSLDGFIVYDKSAKLKIAKKKNLDIDMPNDDLSMIHGPRAGEIPFALSSTTETSELMKEASKLLIDEFNKKVADEEQSDKIES